MKPWTEKKIFSVCERKRAFIQKPERPHDLIKQPEQLKMGKMPEKTELNQEKNKNNK